jgi:hypothetical protein
MSPPTSYLSQMQSEMQRLLPTRSRREKYAFAALPVDEQAWRFMNWLSRRVHPHPRQVNIAQGFFELPAVQANRNEVEALLAKISKGADLNPHLSEDVQEGYCLHPPGRKDGKDFDLLLNEWAIHHLHLSSEPTKRGFNKRTDDLLYVIFGCGVAFVLAVARHRAWTDRKLIEIAVSSWPQQKLFFSLAGVLAGRDWTEAEHYGLRKAGLTVARVVDGKHWMSAISCGMTSALVSTRVRKDAHRVLRCVHQADEHPTHLEWQLVNHANANGKPWPARPAVQIKCFTAQDRYCFGFFEQASGAIVLV